MGQRQLILQGVLSYGKCIELGALSTYALQKKTATTAAFQYVRQTLQSI